MQDDKDDLNGMRNNNRSPKFVEERDPTLLGDCSFIGEDDCPLSYWFGTMA